MMRFIPCDGMTLGNALARAERLPIYIFDCDNVLSNDGWRIPMINWQAATKFERYDNYHVASIMDEPGNAQLLPTEDAVTVMFTAMPENYRPLRERWLQMHGIHMDFLVMRPANDFRPSVAIKKDMLRHALSAFGVEPQQIRAAYDDHAEVVAMYAEAGVAAHRVWLHEVNAYKNPLTGEVTG